MLRQTDNRNDFCRIPEQRYSISKGSGKTDAYKIRRCTGIVATGICFWWIETLLPHLPTKLPTSLGAGKMHWGFKT